MICDAFPIPHIDESVAGAKYFSTLILMLAITRLTFIHVTAKKTALSTPFGHSVYNRLSMGLSNSQSTFQCYIEQILGDRIFSNSVVYLDDLLVFNCNFEEHMSRLKESFDCMQNLDSNLNKRNA